MSQFDNNGGAPTSGAGGTPQQQSQSHQQTPGAVPNTTNRNEMTSANTNITMASTNHSSSTIPSNTTASSLGVSVGVGAGDLQQRQQSLNSISSVTSATQQQMQQTISNNEKIESSNTTTTTKPNNTTTSTTTTNADPTKNIETDTTPTPTPPTTTDNTEPELQAVMEFLKKRGLSNAIMELQSHQEQNINLKKQRLQDETKTTTTATDITTGNNNTTTKDTTPMDCSKDDDNNNNNKNKEDDDELDISMEEAKVDEKVLEKFTTLHQSERYALTLATGGGLGYDLDASPAFLTWDNPIHDDISTNNKHIKSKVIQKSNSSEELMEMETTNEEEERKQVQSKQTMRSFVALQTWVLSLADEDSTAVGGTNNNDGSSGSKNYHLTLDAVIERAKIEAGIIPDPNQKKKEEKQVEEKENDAGTDTQKSDSNDKDETMTDAQQAEEEKNKEGNETTNKDKQSTETTTINPPTSPSSLKKISKTFATFLPKSTKGELLAITFPLFVHTYLDLLESGLECTAASFLSTYRHIHEPYYKDEFRDMDRCCTKKKIMGVKNALERNINAMTSAEIVKKELKELGRKAQMRTGSSSSTNDKNGVSLEMSRLERRYKDLVVKNKELHKKLELFPFLRRIKSSRYFLSISASTFGTLDQFFRMREEFLLPMSVMLQLQCKIAVEKRDPLPFTPACIFEDMLFGSDGLIGSISEEKKSDDQRGKETSTTDDDVQWAAPVHPEVRAAEAGENISILKKNRRLPFPKFHLEKEYETQEDYDNDKKRVEYNRALLINGFRRLEALEVKAEYEVGTRHPRGAGKVEKKVDEIVNPIEPSILLSTLCASSSNSSDVGLVGGAGGSDIEQSLEENGIDICCAKFCPPDGRRVAAGCNDSAIRIWSMESMSASSGGKGSMDSDNRGVKPHESSITLLGHKNGLPIFDVDWNRDGRTLLSAGGDGTIRLWDTMAVGPIGKLAKVVRRSVSTTHAGGNKSTKLTSAPLLKDVSPTTVVPGAKQESLVEKNGAMLTCYRGHAALTPVWAVSMAPCGYYFASAGSDRTARLWCTDRLNPVRLFTGHLSSNVNCITWHPNCNYVLSGSDDKTVRMWDVQTGRSVRLLSGCGFGVNHIEVSPSGQYVAGADYGGIVHIWDLRNGRKLDELHTTHSPGFVASAGAASTIHSMSYSPCGTTLATGGDDCTVRIWDARGLGNHSGNPQFAAHGGWGQGSSSIHDPSLPKAGSREPLKTFRTIRTMIMDLKYTKRNLLLAVGKYSAGGPFGTLHSS